MLGAYVLMQLWGWYMMDYFHLATLPFYVAFGLTYIFTTYCGTHTGIFILAALLEQFKDNNVCKQIKSHPLMMGTIINTCLYLSVWLYGWIGVVFFK